MSEQTLGREIYEKATEYIDSIAAGLGVAAEHVYGVMARQMFVEGIVLTAVWLAVLTVLTVIVVKFAKFTARKWREWSDNDDEFLPALLWAFGGIGYVGALINGLIILPTEIMKIFNPEYYVIREIIGIFGGVS